MHIKRVLKFLRFYVNFCKLKQFFFLRSAAPAATESPAPPHALVRRRPAPPRQEEERLAPVPTLSRVGLWSLGLGLLELGDPVGTGGRQ